MGLRQFRLPHPPFQAFQRFAPSLGGNFGYVFLHIPHWLTILSPYIKTDSRWKFLRAPLPTCYLLSRLMAGFSSAGYRPCQSHRVLSYATDQRSINQLGLSINGRKRDDCTVINHPRMHHTNTSFRFGIRAPKYRHKNRFYICGI